MARNLVDYRVFIASPGGLDEERQQFNDVLREYNAAEANHRGVNFTADGWEDTLSGIGRPQTKINEQIRRCDYFLLLLHDRWGTSPYCTTEENKAYTSATEEEFHVAKKCLNDKAKEMKEIVLFFKAVNEKMLSDPGDQLKGVLTFRGKIEKDKDFLYSTVDSIDSFTKNLMRHLASWVRDHEEQKCKVGVDRKIHIESNYYSHEGGGFGISKNRVEEESIRKAEELGENKKFFESEMLFSEILSLNPSPVVYSRFGRLLIINGQYKRARELITKSIELSKYRKDSLARAYALRQLGKLDHYIGNLYDALSNYNLALAVYNEEDHLEGQARTLRDVSSIYRKQGNFDQAKSELSRSEELYRSINDKEGIASVLGYLGLIYKSIGEFHKALNCHLESLDIHTERNDERAIATVKGNIGVVYRAIAKYEDSLVFNKCALKYYEKVNDARGISREKSNIGITLRLMGEYKQSKEYHLESLAISERMDSRYGVAMQLSNLGAIAFVENDFEGAKKYYLESLEISSVLRNYTGVAIQQEKLGELFLSEDDLVSAEEYLRKAYSGHKKQGNKYGQAKVSNLLGTLFCGTNRHKNAIQYFEKSINTYNTLGLAVKAKEVIDQMSECPTNKVRL